MGVVIGTPRWCLLLYDDGWCRNREKQEQEDEKREICRVVIWLPVFCCMLMTALV